MLQKLSRTEEKAEQKIVAIKKQLLSQMEEKEQQYRKDKEAHLSELTTKLQERDREIHVSWKKKLKSVKVYHNQNAQLYLDCQKRGSVY